MVSHELRAPLASIKGSAATLTGSAETLDPAEMLLFFRIIEQQADQMSALITDLLDMARIETGALPVSAEPADPTILVDQAKEHLPQRRTREPGPHRPGAGPAPRPWRTGAASSRCW